MINEDKVKRPILKITTKIMFILATLFLCVMFVLPKTNQTVYAETTPNYLTLTAKGGTVKITFRYLDGTDVKYSLNGGEWIECNGPAQVDENNVLPLDETGDVFTLEENQYIQFKGTKVKTGYVYKQDDDEMEYYCFSMEAITEGATVEASGDVTSLTNGVGGDVKLTQIGEYQNMFYNCTILTKAPNLPSTTLAVNCYIKMFENTSLESAPELPATTLMQECYMKMFENTSLESAPVV